MNRNQKKHPPKNISRRNPNIHLTQQGVMLRSKDGKSIKVANFIEITEIQVNIDTNEVISKLEYEFRGKRRSIDVKREDYLNKANLIKLQTYGVDVLKSNIDTVIEYLRDEEEQAEEKLVHSKLGFGVYEGTQIYKHYREKTFNSTYCGELDIKPKGTKEAWLEMFHKEVKNQPPLLFMCCVALSAVVATYLEKKVGRESLIVHVVGNSTTGKSTSCKLAVSMFGNADTGTNGLFSTYNSTDNAMMKTLAGIHGMVVALDELSMASMKNQSSFVYKLANGTNKARLNQDSTMKERETWSGTIISNGEKSLLGSSVKNPGLKIRVIEVENVQMTKDARNAEEISETVRNNYGHIGPEFAEFVIKKGTEEVMKVYQKSVEYLTKHLEKRNLVDTFTSRRVNKLALIYTAEKLLEEMLGEKLNSKGIAKILLQIEKESIKVRNIDKDVVEHIQEYISLNTHKFSSKKGEPTAEYWGRIREKATHVEVEFSPIKFEEMLKELEYEDKNVVLKVLKDRHFLECEKDRYTRKRKNQNGVVSNYIVLKLPNFNKEKVERLTELEPLEDVR